MTPAEYTRKNKTWKTLLGKRGVVVSTTQVHVASPELSAFTPYSYAIVDFGPSTDGRKLSLMGVTGEVLAIGDTVECVLRKIAVSDATEIIPYGIKVKKI